MKSKEIELISTTSDMGTKIWYNKTFKVICVKEFNTHVISKIGGIYTVDRIREQEREKYYHIKEIDYWVLGTDFITIEQHRDNQLNDILK